MKYSPKYLVLGWWPFEHLNAESGLFKKHWTTDYVITKQVNLVL